MYVPNLNTKERKCLYYKTYEKIALEKHVNIDHALILNFFEEEINGPIRGTFERQPTKKRFCVLDNAIFKFFVVKDPFKRMMSSKFFFGKTLAI
jgi:hypothetical protein